MVVCARLAPTPLKERKPSSCWGVLLSAFLVILDIPVLPMKGVCVLVGVMFYWEIWGALLLGPPKS